MTDEIAGLWLPQPTRPVPNDSQDGPQVRQPMRVRQSLLALTVELLPWLLGIILLYLMILPVARWLSQFGVVFVGKDLALVTKAARFLLVAELCRRYFNRLYVFDESGVTEHSGVLSTRYNCSRVQYADIRESKIEQNLVGRLLGFGTLKLSTASTSDYEVTLHNVSLPQQLVRCIAPEHGIRTSE